VELLRGVHEILLGTVKHYRRIAERAPRRAAAAEEVVEGVKGGLRALVVGAAGEVARLQRSREAMRSELRDLERQRGEVERQRGELKRRERAVEERERELNLRRRLD